MRVSAARVVGCHHGFVTARLLIEGLSGDPAALVLDGDRIVALGSPAAGAADGARRVDGRGLRAVPGFIELQINGLGEDDITSDPDAVWTVAEHLPRHGVTAFLPTLVSSPPGTVERALASLAHLPGTKSGGAAPLGLHVEGPFLAPGRHGAHDPTCLRNPDVDELRRWVAGGARLVTLAPELPGAIEAIHAIVAEGAVVSIGHTDADAETTGRAIEAGARYATHLFNAMPPLHHRAPGAAGALLDDDRVTLGLIADGTHVDSRLLRLVARAAPGRVSLVSDAVATRLGEAAVGAAGGGGRLADGTLAGGLRLLDEVVRTFAAAVGSVEAAIQAVTAVPARLLGLTDGRGALRVGGRADVVLLDGDLEVAATIVGGHPSFVSDRVAWP